LSSTAQVAPPVTASAKASTSETRFIDRPRTWALCLIILLLVGILRIVSTYHVFNHTIDEPSHIACGVQWWDEGIYQIETKHAPLARISVALGPYLAGVHAINAPTWRETYPILTEPGEDYWHVLTLGRIGVLPYFIIGTLVVFFWTKRIFGAISGLIAAAIFTQLPTILAHSAVATTDMALAVTFCWSLYAFTRWMQEPTLRHSVEFGSATGLAICAKFSTFVFFPACAIPVLVMYFVAGKKEWGRLFRQVWIAALCAFLVTWAVYRFSHAPLARVTAIPDRAAVKIFGPTSGVTSAVHAITAHVPVPAPEIIDGLRVLHNQVQEGVRSYFFGHTKQGGWWYFFFVAMALKTPFAILVLAVIGSVVAARRYWRDRVNWELAVPLVSAAVIMIITMPANLDSGVRYVMPMFLFVSILAAAGVVTLWTSANRQMVWRTAAGLLCAWFVLSSALSHPDYLSYFNFLAGKDPSRIIVVGDYDWGQDMTRLANYLHQHSIQHISIAYDGFYVPASLDLPDTLKLECRVVPSGWVAVEERRVRLYPECYRWIAQQQMVTRVGKTMRLYYVQPGS
jgi:dolichyl-phosphate-mannose-protein mannosyltransferase